MHLFYVWLGLTIVCWIVGILFVNFWFRDGRHED